MLGELFLDGDLCEVGIRSVSGMNEQLDFINEAWVHRLCLSFLTCPTALFGSGIKVAIIQ